MDEAVSDLISVDQAIAILDALPVRPRKVQLPLHDAAGLALAQELSADRDYPAFDKALMDGYALCAADAATIPAELTVIGESPAGAEPGRIAAGEAMAIMTGAALPAGADAVVPIEHTDRPDFATAGQTVRILRPTSPGKAVARRASDTAQGARLASQGDNLNPARIAAAAAVGADPVWVFDRPRCAVLATGDELVEGAHAPTPRQLRNSNNPMLAALLRRLGCAVVDLGLAADRPETIAEAIRRGLMHDCLFITGGMSMGRYDYVPRVLRDLGAQFKITKLRIKPGKPFVLAAMPQGNYVVGLPGNPVSAFVCTLRLASRLLDRIAGATPSNNLVELPLAAALPPNGPREFYQPAILTNGNVRPLDWKGSADIFTLARAGALLIRPENAPAAPAGQRVPVIPFS